MLLLQRSPAQEASLRQLLDAQQTKLSPNYHQWIGPQEFGQRFGPSDADIQAVTSWLISHGFSVNRISAGRIIIEFSGNAGQIRSAFNTEMHKYVVDGREHWANASNPQIPAAFAPVIAGFVSLNNFDIPPAVVRLPLAARLQQAEITSPGATFNSSTYAVGPYDFATIYNALPLWNSTPPIDGTGQTIALAEESDVCTGVHLISPIQTRVGRRRGTIFRRSDHVSTCPSPGGGRPARPGYCERAEPWSIAPTSSANPATLPLEGEAILHADVAGGVAKGAQIDLVVSQATEVTAGVSLSAEYVVDNNLAPVLSVSFLNCQQHLGTFRHVLLRCPLGASRCPGDYRCRERR